MEITDVRIKLVEKSAERLMAFCSITIDKAFVIRELKLIGELIMRRDGMGVPNNNPYRAVMRVLDEWSNASRYNEYLSIGLVELGIEGMEAGLDKRSGVDLIANSLWNAVDAVLLHRDTLAHC